MLYCSGGRGPASAAAVSGGARKGTGAGAGSARAARGQPQCCGDGSATWRLPSGWLWTRGGRQLDGSVVVVHGVHGSALVCVPGRGLRRARGRVDERFPHSGAPRVSVRRGPRGARLVAVSAVRCSAVRGATRMIRARSDVSRSTRFQRPKDSGA